MKKTKVDFSPQTVVDGKASREAIALFISQYVVAIPEEEWPKRVWPMVQKFNTAFTLPLSDKELKQIYNEVLREEYDRAKKNFTKHFDFEFLFTIGKGGQKVTVQNTENICRVLEKHIEFKERFRYDAFKNTIEIFDTSKRWRTIEDNDAVFVQTRIQIMFPEFSKVGKDMVYDAIIKIAKDHKYDSASDYITSLVWDKTSRLDTWLTQVYGVPDDKYHKAVGSNWLKGLIKRIVEPGCKFDYVLVLEGEQGSRKSTSLSILGGSWHVETTMSTDTKDFFMQFQGKALIEFSEGETLSKTEVKRMKAIITMQNDKYRPPYERVSQEFPRRCVFAMTTNQTEYLKDETGNRRWLPITLVKPEADTEWLSLNREQLFAEAYYRIHELKETVYEFPKEETLMAQNARRIHDENADLIVDWYYNKLTEIERSNGTTIHQAWLAMNGGYSSKPLDKWNEMKIADVFKSVLKLEKQRMMIGGVQLTRWLTNIANIKHHQITLEDIKDF